MIRRARFDLRYLFRRTPWDTGVSPPELLAFLDSHPPGRALDLGCGTGTNVVTMAQRGWRVTGVDFSSRAIAAARAKARACRVDVDFLNADVTRLTNLEGPFHLALDIGCYHKLAPEGQARYRVNLDRWMAKEGTYLLYAFVAEAGESSPFLSVDALATQFAPRWTLLAVAVGTDRQRPSAWFTFENRG